MAILCLLLGLLSVVGSGSSQDPSPSVTPPRISTDAPTQPSIVTTQPSIVTTQPTIVTTQPTTVASTTIIVPPAATTAIVNTPANTSPSVLASIAPTTRAPQSATLATPSNGATTGPSAIITTAQVTSTQGGPSKVIQQTTAPVTATPTSHITSTAGNAVTSPLGSSKRPEVTGATDPPRVNATESAPNSTSSVTDTEIQPQSLDTERPKITDRNTPAVPSSTSPHPRMTSSTIAGGIIDTTVTKSGIPLPPSSSSPLPAMPPDSTTRNIGSQTTAVPDKTQKLKEKNIEVKCTNITNENSKSYVKLTVEGSAICDNYGEQAEGGRFTEEFNTIIMHVCKAVKPGYQENQDKCIVRLAKINGNDLVITETFIKSNLQPKELYTQMKRNGANSHLFRYDGAELEDEDVVSIPLISAIASLAVLLLIIAAAYGCWHQRKARKREQRLTEELQTMENGYHDNPTLEVMETSPEMQEKKGGPNGELGDSWIVPLDNLTREDLEEEEDTHL